MVALPWFTLGIMVGTVPALLAQKAPHGSFGKSALDSLVEDEGDALPKIKPPPIPKPLAVRGKDLPSVFTKPTPKTIADLKAIQRHVEGLVKKVSPAVVAVEVGFAGGSGVVISPDGFVLTAGHVCGHPGRPVVFTFADGKTVNGVTMGMDEESDTGLLKITDSGPWPYVPTGSLDGVHVGEWMLALGHPGGFDAKRSLVVRLGRVIQMAPGVVQTDCTISPGDSGGPLFDMYGRVVGIHSAISVSLADNFHVPITDFYDTWDELSLATTKTSQTNRPTSTYDAHVR